MHTSSYRIGKMATLFFESNTASESSSSSEEIDDNVKCVQRSDILSKNATGEEIGTGTGIFTQKIMLKNSLNFSFKKSAPGLTLTSA